VAGGREGETDNRRVRLTVFARRVTRKTLSTEGKVMEYKLRDKRTWVKGILVDCPLGTPLDDCPANEIRNLPVHELVKIVNGLSNEQLDAIIAHHENCLKQRETESE